MAATTPRETAQAVIDKAHQALVEALALTADADDTAAAGPDHLSHLAETHTARGVRLYERLPWVKLAEDLRVNVDAAVTVDSDDIAARVITVATEHASRARDRMRNRRAMPMQEPDAVTRAVQAEARRRADQAFINTLAALGIHSDR
ncbi:hypothetical protein [Micromonospora thermarum]|uniref:YbaB/EbfC DNA-binding family protein n=1 Tax=Micromonospora thermarum TaxID=2720024 RepID=A0ABX0Z8Z5_9ACTN|nr:hypothetical protein [Micromonospora thermarum]NJP33729.1 hypothetical protein [Micromonospora thermarum]